jgi:hypothetical protein
MNELILMPLVMLHIVTARAAERARSRASERGSLSIEHAMWAVGVLTIVAIVVGAVKAYVTIQAGNIK